MKMQTDINPASGMNDQPMLSGIPILTYHSIDESGSVISTSTDVFQTQMKLLADANYNVISLSELARILTAKEGLRAKTLVLTFDDGFQNFYSEAYPVLEQYGFKATVFLVTDFCGKFNDWAGNPPELPRSKVLSWGEIREMDRYGIEFGSHTRTHPDLTRLPVEQGKSEMSESKMAIEDALGRKVETFAYPFGRHNAEIKQIAKENFTAACSTNLGKVRPDSDFFSLNRLDSYYLKNPRLFVMLSSKAFDRYMQFRQAMRIVKSLFN